MCQINFIKTDILYYCNYEISYFSQVLTVYFFFIYANLHNFTVLFLTSYYVMLCIQNSVLPYNIENNQYCYKVCASDVECVVIFLGSIYKLSSDLLWLPMLFIVVY